MRGGGGQWGGRSVSRCLRGVTHLRVCGGVPRGDGQEEGQGGGGSMGGAAGGGVRGPVLAPPPPPVFRSRRPNRRSRGQVPLCMRSCDRPPPPPRAPPRAGGSGRAHQPPEAGLGVRPPPNELWAIARVHRGRSVQRRERNLASSVDREDQRYRSVTKD